MKKDYAFITAIRCFGTLKQLARRIKVSPEVLLYQRNHARSVDLRIALKIEIATQGAVRWYELTEEKDAELLRYLEEKHPVGRSLTHKSSRNSHLSQKEHKKEIINSST